MAIEKLKISLKTKKKKKTCTKPQIKNHKKKLRLIRPQTWHKNPEHMYLNS